MIEDCIFFSDDRSSDRISLALLNAMCTTPIWIRMDGLDYIRIQNSLHIISNYLKLSAVFYIHSVIKRVKELYM